MPMKQKEIYSEPVVSVFTVQSEGVICQSGELSIKDWENTGELITF